MHSINATETNGLRLPHLHQLW